MTATNAQWIDEFGEYLESLLDPSIKSKVKQDYITWIKARENYYAGLSTVAPEFLQLLNVIEKHLKVKVEVEDTKKPVAKKDKGDDTTNKDIKPLTTKDKE